MIMDRATREHFETWLAAHVYASERYEVRQQIDTLITQAPEMLETHSWPELRRIAECMA